MFSNLIVSSSQKDDYRRRGSFFLGALGIYAVFFAAIGVASIYAYDAHVENQNLELIALVTPVDSREVTPRQERRQIARPAAASADNRPAMSVRTENVAPTTDTRIAPRGVFVNTNQAPPSKPGLPSVIWRRNEDIGGGGGGNGKHGIFGDDNNNTTASKEIAELAPEPPPAPRVEKPMQPRLVTKGVINGQATHLPKPPYPALAKAAHAFGVVTVQVLIDEKGKVVSAKAVRGHPLLLQAAEDAAYQARFTPTLLSQQPVKVSGLITYNFLLQ
ncbi:MAG TPA: energy transducer TonB [Pyrinomonadaceae bacterium]|jgi:protein TonB